MGLHPTLRGNIRTKEYESGHMFYIHKESLARFKQDVAAFYKDALAAR